MPVYSLPTPAYLHKRLRYEPSTGKLYWRHCGLMPANWNARWAGQEAFTSTDGRYRQGAVDAQRMYAHRIIWAMVTGKWPKGVDHKSRNKLDNRIANLRKASKAQNACNIVTRADNTSGTTGVRWCKRKCKWQARIMVGGKEKHLGYYEQLDDAKEARRLAEDKQGFYPNRNK